jgi:predicted phosphoribosyltransferase
VTPGAAAERFADRRDAGRRLGVALGSYAGRDDVVVLGLPRGGVPVAYEVAVLLQAPLDVMLVRKLGVPRHTELAFGAIAVGGVRVLNRDVIADAGLTGAEIEEITGEQRLELERRERLYRGDLRAVDLAGRIALLVDDGLATGATMRAAVVATRRRGGRAVVAVPVAAGVAWAAPTRSVEQVVCLIDHASKRGSFAVGRFYDDFSPTGDQEVRELLAAAAAR